MKAIKNRQNNNWVVLKLSNVQRKMVNERPQITAAVIK